jgi:uncharacterized protein (DUF302 family)
MSVLHRPGARRGEEFRGVIGMNLLFLSPTASSLFSDPTQQVGHGAEMAAQGLTTIRSSFGPQETMNRLETAVKAKGMTVFARIDHAAGAAAVGLPLRPTEVLIFGNARGGTPLMQSVQTIGIDLPLKVLVWQDASSDTWLSYSDPAWLAQRHGLGDETQVAVGMMTAALDAVAKAATAG